MVKACWCFGAKTERIFAAAAIATASCLKSTAGETACASAKLAQPADLQLLKLPSDYADTAGRLCWKQSRQSTGRPCVGLNGTVVCLPHCEQMARVSVLVDRDARATCSKIRNPLRLAGLAPFGFVRELLIVEKHLFPGGKNKVRPAVDALQHLVLKLH